MRIAYFQRNLTASSANTQYRPVSVRYSCNGQLGLAGFRDLRDPLLNLVNPRIKNKKFLNFDEKARGVA